MIALSAMQSSTPRTRNKARLPLSDVASRRITGEALFRVQVRWLRHKYASRWNAESWPVIISGDVAYFVTRR
jgi:hypothetical protein